MKTNRPTQSKGYLNVPNLSLLAAEPVKTT